MSLVLVLCLLCGVVTTRAASARAFEWPGRVERLLAQLARPSSEGVRRDLIRLLGASDDPRAVKALEAATRDASPILRAEALRALSRMSRAEPSRVEAVRVALKDSDAGVRRAAVAALARLHPDDSAALLTRTLSDSEPGVRIESARALGALGGPQVLPALAAALDDGSTEVRVAAARAIGALGEARGVGPLLGKARDGAPELREAVIDALHALDRAGPEGDARALGVFAQGLNDPSDLVVFAAMRALSERGLAPFLPTLQELENSPRPRVRAAARVLLESTATPSPETRDAWLPLLERTVHAKPDEATELLEALERALPAGEPLAADPLLAWLPSLDRALWPRLVRLIGLTGARDAAPALEARLEAAAPDLELALVEALGALKDGRSVSVLLPRLARPDARLRHAAAEALEQAAGAAQVPDLARSAIEGPALARLPSLTVLGTVLAKQRVKFSAEAEAQLLAALTELMERPDDALFAAAARVLGLLGTEAAARALGSVEAPSNARRIAVLRAASALPGEAARALRQERGDRASEVQATALYARALAGDPIDLEPSPDTRWPLGPAHAFALAHMNRPERAAPLCALIEARDPWTRANAFAGLARLPLEACADRVGVSLWRVTPSESLRLALAHWARARGARAPGAAELLARCASDDNPRVRAACAGKPIARHASARREGAHVSALVLEDGSVIVSVPDGSNDPTWPHVREVGVEMPWNAPYAHD